MLELAEKEAVKRGCCWSHLGALDFQALDFYYKQGFKIASILQNLPPGHKKDILRKKLV
jgi:hypothetical protein